LRASVSSAEVAPAYRTEARNLAVSPKARAKSSDGKGIVFANPAVRILRELTRPQQASSSKARGHFLTEAEP
jgi:hypothetical protein